MFPAIDAGYPDVDLPAVLKEIQVAPDILPRIVDAAVFTTGGTGELDPLGKNRRRCVPPSDEPPVRKGPSLPK